jgi:hypothetical protein
MQAILTKYLGPTNFRGARIKASAQAGSVTVPWDYELNVEKNHQQAAEALCEKLGWRRPTDFRYSRALVSGALPNDDYAHVFAK